MNWLCTAINSAWLASCLPGAWRFQSALKDPQRAQFGILQRLVRRNYDSAFGEEHGFSSICSYEDFTNAVPIRTYDEMLPWIERVQRGERSILTTERATHLIPTSGSTSARKLIPFTAGLQRDFDAAIAPWIADLFLRMPSLMGGPAYWSITPKGESRDEASAVPIGFESDADYLGGVKVKLVQAVMVRPHSAALAESLPEFRFATLAALLRARDLRFISVWHPSFLTLLLDEIPENWNRLRAALPERQLPRTAPEDFRVLWPHLKLISCWADGHAEGGARELARRFSGVAVQAKGLLATEGCISVPFSGRHPLAVTSHFFEFVDDFGKVRRAHELEMGAIYEVVVTTAGGLWRYRLGDRVLVDEFLSKTPSIRFVGRSGQVSDLCGEKLSEAFVADCIRRLGRDFRFAMLAPCIDTTPPHYVFIVEAPDAANCDAQLEQLLCENPHYRYARELGQLGPVRLRHVTKNAYALYSEHLVGRGQRLGDIKPVALAKENYWSKIFAPSAEPKKNEFQQALI
jgi:hypothetical protein